MANELNEEIIFLNFEKIRNLNVLVMLVSLWSAVCTRRLESRKKRTKIVRYNSSRKYLRHFDSERPIFQCRTNLATKGKKKGRKSDTS